MKRKTQFNSFVTGSVLALMTWTLCGCFGGPKPVKAPEWDPAGMAAVAMQSDTNGDGFLDETELDQLPGLKAGLRALDTDNDKKASPAEIEARLVTYVETKTGARPVQLKFIRKGKPVADAKVRMVPEAFLNGIVEVAEGQSKGDGQVMMGIPGVFTDVMRVGYYKIEVTSDSVDIPAKYNTESTIGFEVAPVMDGFQPKTTFDLK